MDAFFQSVCEFFQTDGAGIVTVFSAVWRYAAPLLAILIIWRAAAPLLNFRREPEIWAYLAMPDGQQFPVTHWENILGRGKGCDLVINHPDLARNHAVLTRYDDGSWSITDIGARGWIYIGSLSVQPAELVKLCFVYVGASTMDRIVTKRNLITFIIYSVVICGCLAFMNDFGAALIFFVTFLVIAFLRSGSFATVALACSATGIAGLMAIRLRPHILKRFSNWGHVWEDTQGGGFDQSRAMMCVACGGLFGVGAGKGIFKLQHILAADTDYVFAFLCEEWGLIIGVLAVAAIIVLGLFVLRSSAVGRSSFYTIGACAAVAILMTQTILNVFGTMDLLPLTGVTFPFLSNGGSSMLCSWGLLAFIKAADTRQNASLAVQTLKAEEVEPLE